MHNTMVANFQGLHSLMRMQCSARDVVVAFRLPAMQVKSLSMQVIGDATRATKDERSTGVKRGFKVCSSSVRNATRSAMEER